MASSGSGRAGRRRGILRYGETMETFFGLDQNSSAEYWRLCRQVVDGSAADDPEAWNRVLEAARSQHAGASNRGTIGK
jgi:hypothetical protein